MDRAELSSIPLASPPEEGPCQAPMFPCPTFSPPPVDLLGPAPNRFLDIILLENELSQQVT